MIEISIFGSPKKFLVNNGREFNNHGLICLCEIIHIHICTTAAGTLCSNGPEGSCYAIQGYTEIIAIDYVKCDFN